MATLGYKMDNAKDSMNEASILHTTRNGIKALGVYDGEKFDVLEGSEISGKTLKRVPASIERQRQAAMKNGDIVERDGKLYLVVSMSFSSPSYAAAFVYGTNANGWTEWKASNGKTLDEIYRR